MVAVREPSFQFVMEKLKYVNPMTHGTKNVEYLAFYRTQPFSAITHYGQVKEIKNNVSYTEYFEKKPDWLKNGVLLKCYYLKWIKELDSPISQSRKYRAIYGPKYTTLEKLFSAKNLSGVFK